MTAYERFEELCKERGIAPTTAMVQAGLSKALASKWKTSADVTPPVLSHSFDVNDLLWL